MANPRKFSEKIALHNQKQAEETAAFEQIMKEVSDATNKSALSNLEEMKTGRADNPMVYRERGRTSVGVGPMRSRPIEKRIDTSPYSSGAYLSPPPDTSWRRTNSDSALHQSTMNVHAVDSSIHSSSSQRRVTDGQIVGIVTSDQDTGRRQTSVSPDGRPRSCCEVPRVPGINIYPSQQEPGTVQIPIGNNTGSLPDLTSFHFPSPLPTPLDQEDHSSSPYSSSPQATSPATLSPTSLPSRPMGRFSFTSGSPQESRGPSPGHSPDSRRRQYHNHTLLQNVIPPGSQNTTQTAGVTLDTSKVQLEAFHQNQYIYQQHPSQQTNQQIHQQCNQNLISTSQSIPTAHHMNSLSSYRSSQPLSRPSPQTSPGLTVQQGSSLVYRSGSPGETSHSGPQSPVSPASSPGAGPNSNPFSDHNNYFLSQAQANALQQHFEQFSMLDNPVSTSINLICSQNSTTHYSQAVSHGSPDDSLTQVSGQEIPTDPGYYSQSPSQLHYRPASGTQQTTPQTPNTPTSIPDIILTDFSSRVGDDLARHEFVKDIGSAMSGSFDSDLFTSDVETLREGLDPIDLDGLQMLTDPDMNVITDPTTEDNFRLDRL